MDFAPDYGYYTSDVARMWAVSGKFSPMQRELLQFVLDYRNAVLKRIRPGVAAKDIQDEVKVAMEEVFKKTKFSKPVYEQAARKMVETGGGVFSHPVGMAVHDDGGYRNGVLKPGHVFSIDPQLWVPEETLYIRYEGGKFDEAILRQVPVGDATFLALHLQRDESFKPGLGFKTSLLQEIQTWRNLGSEHTRSFWLLPFGGHCLARLLIHILFTSPFIYPPCQIRQLWSTELMA